MLLFYQTQKVFHIISCYSVMEMSKDALFKQGAEGRLFKIQYLGKPAILKERFEKKYRHTELDARLTKERIRAESKSISRCKKAGILVPDVYSVDFQSRIIIIEFIADSITISEKIQQLDAEPSQNKRQELEIIARDMGTIISKMHFNNIIHGDLTTSNILFQHTNDGTPRLYIIDFGLSYVKSSVEDKAVDLYVLERALKSKHNDITWFFNTFLESYMKFDDSCVKVLKKFEEVRSRGRKRNMIG